MTSAADVRTTKIIYPLLITTGHPMANTRQKNNENSLLAVLSSHEMLYDKLGPDYIVLYFGQHLTASFFHHTMYVPSAAHSGL
jgi:hypothetical protein